MNVEFQALTVQIERLQAENVYLKRLLDEAGIPYERKQNANSRFLYLGEDDNGYLCIPRGLLDTLLERCKEAEISTETEDRRERGRNLDVQFQGELRENQKEAVRTIRKYDCGILSAATAFGKTVVCSALIAERKVSTLILLESSALINQWQKALEQFLDFHEELPEYETKTGRKKRRKSMFRIIVITLR